MAVVIECHIGICEYHACHTGFDEGPSCSLGECVKSSQELIQFAEQLGVNYDCEADEGSETDAAAESVPVSCVA